MAWLSSPQQPFRLHSTGCCRAPATREAQASGEEGKGPLGQLSCSVPLPPAQPQPRVAFVAWWGQPRPSRCDTFKLQAAFCPVLKLWLNHQLLFSKSQDTAWIYTVISE
uniref:Uncharacterized protein n=1 Tax=Micrurus surinamensis TaxID=129470 RepID=A0A2D4PZS5_MICSU